MSLRGLFLTVIVLILSAATIADTAWNTSSGTWSDSSDWSNGVPDSSDSYIYIRYSSSSVCTLNTDEGLFPARLVMQSGQTLNIENGGLVGTAWSRVGRESSAYVNLSGTGTFVMNDDDMYLGLEGGSCVWTMSDTSSLYVEESTAGGDNLYLGKDGGTGKLKLVGSGVTVNIDALYLGVSSSSDKAILHFDLDTSGASTIVTGTTSIAPYGSAYLVVSSAVTPPQTDIILIQNTSTTAIGGNGVFDSANSSSAAEGAMIDINGQRYSITYQYDADGDSANNDIALLYVGTTPCAYDPSPEAGDELDATATTLLWTNPDGSVRQEVYFGTDQATVTNAAKPLADVDGSGTVDLADIKEMAGQWLDTPVDPCPDIDFSGLINLYDFLEVGLSWQTQADSEYLGATTDNVFDVSSLEDGKTYYWRVDSVYCDKIEQSPVWSFSTKLPAFPGADGFGKWATGGRGGSVYHVTNLNDSGTGSFRDAVSQSGRTVVFDVSGIINMESRIVVENDITIAGQTAPGEGILVYGDGFSYTNADRAITRYMRYRMGAGGTSGKDAVGIADGQNMIFDHCSITWGRDETFSISGGSDEDPGLITIQDCIIGQGLVSHSCGGLLIDWEDGISVIRSMYIDNNTRNPKVRGINEFINNVVYNWDSAAYIMAWTSSTDYYSYVNAYNNYFICGPNMDNTPPFRYGNSSFNIYHNNNWYDTDKDGTLDGRVLTDDDYTSNNETVVSTAYDYPGVNTLLDPFIAVKSIGSVCGASLPARDKTDFRLIQELMSYGTKGQHISDEDDSPMNGVGIVASGICPTDTDQDGMPDYWEESITGLDPDVADNNGDINSNGYTNLEDYINWLAVPHEDVQKNYPVVVDLRNFTYGFDLSSATYTISNPVNGTISQSANGWNITFTPDTDYIGPASFDFQIEEGGSTKDHTVELLVSEYGGHPLPALNPTDLTNGLLYYYYQGTWEFLPDFSTLSTYDEGIVSNFSLSPASDTAGYAFEYYGYIEIPTDGQYTFYHQADDGGRLYIDDGVVVSNDGMDDITQQQGTVSLMAGMHKIRVTYFENTGDNFIHIRWAGPGFTRQYIPDASLYYAAPLIQEGQPGFCSVDGAIETTNSGYTGQGYANTDNASGNGVDWAVTVSTAGTYTINFRYANGGSADRPGDLYVDGSVETADVSFPATGGWATWDTTSTTATLSAGSHTLRLEATGSSGLGNVDYIEIESSNVVPNRCQ